jgi:hypothetical protein
MHPVIGCENQRRGKANGESGVPANEGAERMSALAAMGSDAKDSACRPAVFSEGHFIGVIEDPGWLHPNQSRQADFRVLIRKRPPLHSRLVPTPKSSLESVLVHR